jgi:hypothetical protein
MSLGGPRDRRLACSWTSVAGYRPPATGARRFPCGVSFSAISEARSILRVLPPKQAGPHNPPPHPRSRLAALRLFPDWGRDQGRSRRGCRTRMSRSTTKIVAGFIDFHGIELVMSRTTPVGSYGLGTNFPNRLAAPSNSGFPEQISTGINGYLARTRSASASPSRMPGVWMSVNTKSIGSPDLMNSIATSAHPASIT